MFFLIWIASLEIWYDSEYEYCYKSYLYGTKWIATLLWYIFMYIRRFVVLLCMYAIIACICKVTCSSFCLSLTQTCSLLHAYNTSFDIQQLPSDEECQLCSCTAQGNTTHKFLDTCGCNLCTNSNYALKFLTNWCVFPWNLMVPVQAWPST